MEYFTIKNWRIHQQYKKRNDPWIKLHTDLLTDYDFTMLSNDSKLLLIHIWLLSSKLGVDEPKIPNDVLWICGQTNLKGEHSLKPLFDNGFINMISNDSDTLHSSSDSYKININKIHIKNINKTHTNTEEADGWFDEDWSSYPRKAGSKSKAKKCYLKSITSLDKRREFHEKTRLYITNTDPAYLKYGETWFRNWEDHEVAVKIEPQTKTGKAMELIQNFKSGGLDGIRRNIQDGDSDVKTRRIEGGGGLTVADVEGFGK